MTGEHPSGSMTVGGYDAVLRERVISLRRDLDAHAANDQRERDRIERVHTEGVARIDRRLDDMQREHAAQTDSVLETVGELKVMVGRVTAAGVPQRIGPEADTAPMSMPIKAAPSPTGPHPDVAVATASVLNAKAKVWLAIAGAVTVLSTALAAWLAVTGKG